MSVEPARIVSQPEVASPSSSPGSVAPSPGGQGYGQTPGAQTGQPAESVTTIPASTPSQGASQAGPSGFDYGALERERQARVQAEQQVAQFRGALGQVAQQAQQSQAEQAAQQQIQMALAQAENMPSEQANQFLRNQMLNIRNQERIAAQQALQQREAQFDQERRVLAAQPYAEYLATENGLSAEAKQELLELGDPDLMYRQVGSIKRRHDAWEQRFQQVTNGNVQLARTQEVNAIRQAGLANVGGAAGTGSYQIEVSDDPDVAAVQIYNHIHGLD